MTKLAKGLLWGAGGLIGLLIVAGLVSGPRDGAAPGAAAVAPAAPAPAAAAPLPQYTAAELARAYEENAVAADAKFKGKRFQVSGTVAEISTDLFGDPAVTLKGGVNQFLEPTFGFDKSQLDAIAKLRKGQKISLACKGMGDVIKAPQSGGCTLL